MRLSITAALLASAIAVAGRAEAQSEAREQYRVSLPAAVEVEPQASGGAALAIKARRGCSISRDGPVAVKLGVTPEKGIQLPKKKYVRGDAADAHAANPRFDLLFKAVAEGEFRLAVEIRFWVCTRRTCRPVREVREVAIRAAKKAPPPDAGAGRP